MDANCPESPHRKRSTPAEAAARHHASTGRSHRPGLLPATAEAACGSLRVKQHHGRGADQAC